ncbi:MAG: sodium:proton antiporter NhaD [Marinilabiliales bacterium]|nr:sodium:proton antiporter NhaD [Marinilabiliales bacterium]
MTTLILSIFILGYAAIAFESRIKVNKSAIALITGTLCWTAFIVLSPDKQRILMALNEHLSDISSILFFLLGAMTIVELIDAHEGFELLTNYIKQKEKWKLLWIIGLLTFFLSSILDNLTTTIVMISLIRKLVPVASDRLKIASIIIIAANAGGAWTPIGDVTTTMLWMGDQITTLNIMKTLFLPSFFCVLTPLVYFSIGMKGSYPSTPQIKTYVTSHSALNKAVVLFTGILILILVPIFKTTTNLPPFMGMLLGLGLLWMLTEIMHLNKPEEVRHLLSVNQALRKIDTPSVLFFLGILLSVASLQTSGILPDIAKTISQSIANEKIVVVFIGLLSSIVDNVPLVAAAQGMYTL